MICAMLLACIVAGRPGALPLQPRLVVSLAETGAGHSSPALLSELPVLDGQWVEASPFPLLPLTIWTAMLLVMLLSVHSSIPSPAVAAGRRRVSRATGPPCN